ncbi:uncharacterized protein F4807DRAFT_441221 [Annulohypoxylon truncatum]|uniref:uncharacterized protein n=1 Tax=Annulohypoxylon truncatum TaxID=327061 RepID=UPI002007F96D|nr:uncharacterized protein F4807DRAFT_441221 [Annulohypoxylon truncatum]KAI1205977.1 hypothetical protein F4807DRAFT_441221 [Annulohypoxylon truncatum]
MDRLPSPARPSSRSSSIEVSFHTYSPPSPRSRRQSKSSFQDPLTPLRNSMNESELNDLSGGGMGQDNGLGNLADELADALSGSGDDEEYYEDEEGSSRLGFDQKRDDGRDSADGIRDSGVDVASQSGQHGRTKSTSLGIPSPPGRGHRRTASAYDGSEYGSESDLDSPGMPPSLVAKIDAVESLARRGTESNGGPTDGVFQRLTDGLKDLGSQSSVEGSTTRLITAHSALATHLAHQTRQIHNLTFSLLSPLVTPPDPETIDSLLPLLTSVSDEMPRPATSAYNSLTALHSVTSDLVQTLNYLSDTLHMSRQTTTTATRRLRTAKEMVAEMKREEELKEEGERWLTRGNWGERLQKRECAGVCREVVGGFEEVCNGWRARLLAQAESA